MYVYVNINEFKGKEPWKKAAKFLKERTHATDGRRSWYGYSVSTEGVMAICTDENLNAYYREAPRYINPHRFAEMQKYSTCVQIFYSADIRPLGEL
jgi:hypothetical protein